MNVSDVSEAIYKILKRNEKNPNNYILNCGSGKGISVKSIANEFKKR